MKKFVIAGSMVIATTVVLIQCKNAKNTTHNNSTNNAGDTKKMTRTKTASGLEYEIMQEGAGASPKPGSMVTVHYTGWLNKDGQPTGQPFDSSHNRRQPFTFQIGVGMVIQGWDEGVMNMKIGEKRRLYIPSQLGYGKRGAGHVIPGDADLIFDVELISIS
jgi:FKBP-type peptidyl-prolyl cis-trans isomerase